MTVPTKAAMKQLLDERMIAGSASNWLPPAMFFLQLNLSGVIILLSLMFYANALGESFVTGLGVGFCFFPFSCVMYVWVYSLVELGRWRGSVGGVAFGSHVRIFFLSAMKIFAFFEPCLCCPDYFLYTLGFSLMEIRRLKSHCAPAEEETLLTSSLPLSARAPLAESTCIDIKLNVLTRSHHDRWRCVANLGGLDIQYGASRWPKKVWRINNSLFSYQHRFLSSTVPAENNIIMSLHPATLTLLHQEKCGSHK